MTRKFLTVSSLEFRMPIVMPIAVLENRNRGIELRLSRRHFLPTDSGNHHDPERTHLRFPSRSSDRICFTKFPSALLLLLHFERLASLGWVGSD